MTQGSYTRLLGTDFTTRRMLANLTTNEPAFPWRASRDPFQLIIAELMLIRTSAKQVVPVWSSFVSRFPDVNSLSCADRAEVRAHLASLGLRWRADLIYSLATFMTATGQAEFPRDEKGLSALLPFGGYVAKAVALQIAGKGDLPVDVGIARFLARFRGMNVPKDARRLPAVIQQAEATGQWTRDEFYGLLDLVRTKCRARMPLCGECPLKRVCAHGKEVTRERGRVSESPSP